MAMPEAALAQSARRAYEIGRTKWALARSIPILPATALALLNCNGNGALATLACVTLVAILFFAWLRRGGDSARGARAGLLAGLAPFLIPPAAQMYATWEPSVASFACLVGCLAGGLLAGLVLTSSEAAASHASRDYWTGALSVCIAAGAAGCLFAGLIGLAGMAIGMGLGATPMLVSRRA